MKFREEIEKDFTHFMQKLSNNLKEKRLDLDAYILDHICLRVSSNDAYATYQLKLSSIGKLLIESDVGGRSISTYKLEKPLVYNSREIFIVELPSPKKSSSYPTGFEHVEFVIDVSFEDFITRHSSLQFDKKGLSKSFNPELRLKLDDYMSVKFHHMSLEKVIDIEKSMS